MAFRGDGDGWEGGEGGQEEDEDEDEEEDANKVFDNCEMTTDRAHQCRWNVSFAQSAFSHPARGLGDT